MDAKDRTDGTPASDTSVSPPPPDTKTPVDGDHPALEVSKALSLLMEHVDFEKADQMQPLGAAAVYSTSIVLWLLTYQRLEQNASLDRAVRHMIASAPRLCPDNKRVREGTLSPGTGSYSSARKRLSLEVAQWFADEVSHSIISTAGCSLGARRVFVLDGTTITLAPEKELRRIFPPASNQFGAGVWPVALLLVAHELESGCALPPEIGPMYGSNAVSETALARACLARIPAGSVVLGDINFGIFSMAWNARQHQLGFLYRMNQSRFNALRAKATLLTDGPGCKTWSLRWVPTSKERRTNPWLPAGAAVDVRLHEVVVHSGLTLWLVTDLPDPVPVVSALYLRRGEIEIDIRNFKVVLNTEQIRARSEDMFRKELLMATVAYNLVVQFRRVAAREARLPVKRLSFTKVWNTFRQFLLNCFSLELAQWEVQYELALKYAMQTKLPNRPGRSFERVTYPRRAKGNQFGKRTVPPDTNPAELVK